MQFTTRQNINDYLDVRHQKDGFVFITDTTTGAVIKLHYTAIRLIHQAILGNTDVLKRELHNPPPMNTPE